MKRLISFLPLLMVACSIPSRLPALPTITPASVQPVTSAPPTDHGESGHVIGLVNVRNTPEANGAESWTVDTLKPGDDVTGIQCVIVGNAVWVRHVTGWSVARNAAGIYITGVCE